MKVIDFSKKTQLLREQITKKGKSMSFQEWVGVAFDEGVSFEL